MQSPGEELPPPVPLNHVDPRPYIAGIPAHEAVVVIIRPEIVPMVDTCPEAIIRAVGVKDRSAGCKFEENVETDISYRHLHSPGDRISIEFSVREAAIVEAVD